MDCGDNSCVFALARGGMRTNGGCRCLDGVAVELRRELQSYAIGVRRDRDTLREQLAGVTAKVAEQADYIAFLENDDSAEYLALEKERDELRAIVVALLRAKARHLGMLRSMNATFAARAIIELADEIESAEVKADD